MDNLRAVIQNMFCYISPQEIIKGNITYDNINESTFMKLGSGYIKKYSNDEIRNMYYYLKSEFEWQNHKVRSSPPAREEAHTLNVFDALMAFNYNVLIEENGVPLCQYSHLLRWREMTIALEEDLFVASYFAMQDVVRGRKRYQFFWKPVIGHNNFTLNQLVARGLAENHFHLKGSAPMFHLSWLSIMNHIDKEEYIDVFQKFDRYKLHTNLSYDVNYGQVEFPVMWWQAALIRMFLFAKIKKDTIYFDKTYVSVKTLLIECNKEERLKIKKIIEDKEISMEQKVVLEECEEDLGETTRLKMREMYAEQMIEAMLKDSSLLAEHIQILQRNIERLKESYGKSDYDYAICEQWLVQNMDNGTNEVISGERWFMYSIFSHVYSNADGWKASANWFYLYLVLKANIRMEIVQANKGVGFDNFANYQDRKENFIDKTEYEEIYVRMSVRDTIFNQHIDSLEARVTPKTSADEIQEGIQKYDKWICKGMGEKEADEFKKKYFYVMHFVKERDGRENISEYRHYTLRQKVKIQAQAIAETRQKFPNEGRRIHGIDACAAEIGCRPEIFAQAYRYLKNDCYEQKFNDGLIACGFQRSRNIMATYHAGEDFLDVIDGLRAIDEVISFLDFKCGDRLGHALALGVDVEDWYRKKSNRILISKQDYLDNLVWVYAKIRKYNLGECEAAKNYIEKRFGEYFNEIYRNNLTSEMCRGIHENAKKYFDDRGLPHGYNHYENMSFGINEYYDAWKLRGDAPELYREGFFKLKDLVLDDMDYYAINKNFPQNYRIRYNPEAALLYHMYHYNSNVILVGNQYVEIKVNENLIDAVKKVQYMMQKEIARLGISIETNPSSNYMIGTFGRYDKHPIIKWYNSGLVNESKMLSECPQIQVSINTDDQGVFSTYIENEYAYMALALEKSLDEKGNSLYSRNAILRWLENIRLMGMEQSF